MKYGLFHPTIHFTLYAMSTVSSSTPPDPDVSLTHWRVCVFVCVHGCKQGTHGLIFYPDASLSAAHSWHSTAGHSLRERKRVCVTISLFNTHTWMASISSVAINLRHIPCNPTPNIDDRHGIFPNRDHTNPPMPLLSVTHLYCMSRW